MATPISAPASAPSSFTVGDVTGSQFVVGNGNRQISFGGVGANAQVNYYEAGSAPEIIPRPRPVTLRPRTFPGLLGRDHELSELVSDSQSGIVSLWAPNGMGKSVLARSFVNSPAVSDPAASVVLLQSDERRAMDLLQKLFGIFYDCPPSYVPDEPAVRKAFQTIQSLVVLDNLAWSDEELNTLINVAPKCSFVLISTERLLAGESTELALQGLPDSDAVKLFQSNFGAALDDAGRDIAARICSLLNDCPDLIIKVASRAKSAKMPLPQLLSDLNASRTADPSLASFVTTNLSDAEKQLLGILAAAGENPVPTARLVAALPSVDVEAVLAHLGELHLVQSHSPRYSLCGSLSSDLAARWDITPARDTLLQDSITWLSQREPPENVRDALGMLLHVLKDAVSRKKWREVIQLGRLMEWYLVADKRWQSWSDILNMIMQAARAVADRSVEAWALHQLGSHAFAEGQFEAARSSLNQALKIRQAIHDKAGIEATRHNLNALNAAMGTSAQGSGPSGTSPLTYGFFGIGGIVVIAAAAWFLTHRPNTPPPTAIVPPPAVTTPAPLVFTDTPTPTATSTPTETPTSPPTDTPTVTPTDTPTDTPTPQGPFGAVVTVPDKYLACHYGPGAAYFQRTGLPNGSEVKVIGKQDTVFGTWVYVNYVPLFAAAKLNGISCWVNPQYLKMDGDPAGLPNYYPDQAPLILYYHPGATFPVPTNVSASRSASGVTITWTGYVLYPGDREYPTAPLFLVEAWTCINGQFLLSPLGVDTADHTGDAGTFVNESVDVQDDGSCGQKPYGNVYLAQRDGYVGPAPVIPWP